MKKLGKSKLLSMVLTSLFLFNILSNLVTSTARADTSDIIFKIEKTVDVSDVYAGEEFTYTIKYSNPNITVDARNVVIIDKLPSNIQYVSSTPSADIESVDITKVNGSDVVTFKFKEPMKAGVSGFVKITAKFPEGITVGGSLNVAKNTALIKGDNGLDVISNEAIVTPKVKAPDWNIIKTKIIPQGTPAVDQPVTYRITLSGNSKIGGLNLHDVIVTDTIPQGSQYVSSSDAGSYSTVDNRVTWNIGDVTVGNSVSRTITVKYPIPTFGNGDSVTNIADGYVQLFGETTQLTKQATISHSFVDAVASLGTFTKNSRQADDRYSVGQEARFKLSGIENTGNVPLDSIEIIDKIPSEITLTSISTGRYSDTANIEVQYEINGENIWRSWTGSSVVSTNNKSLDAASIPLNPGEKITAVKWIITNGAEGIASGFKEVEAISVNGNVAMPVSGNTITNNSTLSAVYAGALLPQKDASKTISVIDSMPWIIAEKTVKNGQVKFNMNDTVEYHLRIKNHDYATGDYINPIAIDVLPAEMESVTLSDITWNKGNSNITTNPVVDISGTKTIGVKNHQIIKWNFAGDLKPGQYVDITYTAKIKDQTLAGTVTNKFYITTNNGNNFENPPAELLNDVNDLDGDSDLSDKLVQSSRDIFVNFTGSLDSQKWVKGELDTTWGYYGVDVGFGKTLPGGIADYQLKVKNIGSNGPISNIVVIDILPYIGDTGVIDSKPRDSDWRPYLVNHITEANGVPLRVGVKVYYSTNSNPSKQELSNPIVNKGLPGDGWSLTPPADITSVRALKFDFGSGIVLEKDEEITLEWPMRAPYAAPQYKELENKIAWNSFGYSATYPDTSGPEAFLPSEPKKVGFEVQIDPSAKYYIGDFVWEDMNKNGIQDFAELGINGILVKLYKDINNGVGPPIYEDTLRYTRTGNSHSSQAGYYEFPNLGVGKYKVQFIFPKDYKVTPYKQGSDTELDSNLEWTSFSDLNSKLVDYADNTIVKSALYSDPIVLGNENDFSIDVGLYKLASLGDFVWNDKNANGIQNTGEPGIQNVKVELLNKDGITPATYGNGTTVPITYTNATGEYRFIDLEPGEYKVKFTSPNGDYKFSDVNKSTDDIDSDAIYDNNAPLSTATTGAITLRSGENNMSVDAGMYLAQIGDFVWHDKNTNGIQDEGEGGIVGVKVNLFQGDGITPAKDVYGVDVPQATTNSSGAYLFDSLKPGNYVVQFIKPTDYDKFSKSLQGTDLLKDSDADVVSGKTGVITLTAGERDAYSMSWDAGLYKFASIGDKVWNDKNGNGIQDMGAYNEPGILGVTVNLYKSDGTFVGTTTTNSNGSYVFTGLEPGDYYVEFINPSDYVFSIKDASLNSKDAIDSDADITTGKTVSTTLTSDENDTSWDAGLHKGYIGNYVWEDKDANGKQDDGNVGINGVTVNLYDNTGSNLLKIFITKTGPDGKAGYYEFTDLDPADYYVEVVKPIGYVITDVNQGTDDKIDSDINSSGKTSVINLAKGQIDDTLDAGMWKPAALGDFVWLDKNGNGVQDALEPGISSVTIKLYDKDGNPAKYGDGTLVLNAVTDVNGRYSFTNLVPGSYTVEFVKNSYYNYSETNKGSNVAIDSNANTSTGKTSTIALKSGDNNASIDAGYVLNASIDLLKRVYIGHNGGTGTGLTSVKGEKGTLITYIFTVKNTGTTYLNDVTIDDLTLSINKGDMTKLSGNDLLAPGETVIYYYETTINNDLTNTAKAEGTPSDSAGIDLKGNKVSDTDTAVVGELIPKIEVQKTVYAGHDGGLQTGDELVVGERGTSITYVFSIKNTGNVHLNDITISDAKLGIDKSKMIKISGNEPLAPGASIIYYYETAINGDLTNTVKVEGTPSDNLGNIITSASKPTAQDTAAVDEVKPVISVDKTVYKGHNSGSSTGVEIIADKDGSNITYKFVVKNNGDTYLKDIMINDAALGIDKSKIINISGVEPLAPGESLIYYYEAKISGDLINEVGVSGTPCNSAGTLVPNTNNPASKDTAEVKVSASVGDYVWNDINADGKQDSDEKGISNVRVVLTDDKGNITSTVTNANGRYIFDNLMPGDYSISIDKATLPPGLAESFELDRTLDNKVNFALASAQAKDDVDFGYYVPVVPILLGSIGDTVWADNNLNGLQDMFELGIPNVVVNLLDSNGKKLAETTTDIAGKYLFKDVMPGTYMVEVIKPSAYKFTLSKVGINDLLDSDVDEVTAKTALINLKWGENIISVDAGMYKLASVGDYVWHDANGDGIQTSNEKSIPGVKITLTDALGNVTTTITDNTGKYIFENLVPGSYTVSVDKTTLPKDLKETYELDKILDGMASITLINGQFKDDVDFGYNKNGVGIDDNTVPGGPGEFKTSVGDYVWYDANGNGKQEPNEKGISGVKIILTSSQGIEITTITDELGKYIFENVVLGKYTVTIDKTTLPKGIKESYELDKTLDGKVEVTLNTTEFKDDVDFGYNKNGMYIDDDDIPEGAGDITTSVGDYVWYDTNGNGKQEPNEKGIAGVRIILADFYGNEMTTTTDSLGKYIFKDIPLARYIITIDKNTLPKGMKATYELDKSLDGKVEVILITAEFKEDVDFGYNKGGFGIDDDKLPGSPSKLDEGELPKTGTENYNLLLSGILLLLVSAGFILFYKSKEN